MNSTLPYGHDTRLRTVASSASASVARSLATFGFPYLDCFSPRFKLASQP